MSYGIVATIIRLPYRENKNDSPGDNIREDENLVLGTWSSEAFTIFGIAAVIVLLFLFIFVIGPPPDDGRCSLPWC